MRFLEKQLFVAIALLGSGLAFAAEPSVLTGKPGEIALVMPPETGFSWVPRELKQAEEVQMRQNRETGVMTITGPSKLTLFKPGKQRSEDPADVLATVESTSRLVASPSHGLALSARLSIVPGKDGVVVVSLPPEIDNYRVESEKGAKGKIQEQEDRGFSTTTLSHPSKLVVLKSGAENSPGRSYDSADVITTVAADKLVIRRYHAQ